MPLVMWPSTIPQTFMVSDFLESDADAIIKDEYNVGPPSYRRRTTAAPANFSGTMAMTTEEWITLRSFFHTTLFDGALRFLFPPQAVSDASRFWITRFRAPPMRQLSNADDLWFVGLEMERLGINGALLSPQLLSDRDTFYRPNLIYDQIAIANRYDDPDIFRVAIVTSPGAALSLTAGIYSDSDALYAPTVSVVGGAESASEAFAEGAWSES